MPEPENRLCVGCSAFLYTDTEKCHGCRSGPPEQRLEAPTMNFGRSPFRDVFQLWLAQHQLWREYAEFTRGNAD